MSDRPTPINPADDELRDPHLDALWRALPVERPPLELDAALRAAARREAASEPQSGQPAVAEATRPERWWWPLAAAATIGAIAIGILQLVNEPPNERDPVSDMPRAPASRSGVAKQEPVSRSDAAKSAPALAPALAPEGRETNTRAQAEAVEPRETRAKVKADAVPVPEQAPRKPTQREEKTPREALDARTAAGQASKKDTRLNAPADQALSKSSGNIVASTPPPALADTKPLRTDAPTVAGVASDQAAQSNELRSLPPRAEASAGAARQKREADDAAVQSSPTAKVGAVRDRNERGAVVSERATRPVAEWIALIRRLRDDGATAEASRELGAFREAHPDAERLLPPDLRDWRPPRP
jgi:hypothetical protein